MGVTIFKIKNFAVNIKLFGMKFYCGLIMTILSAAVLQLMGASSRALIALPLMFFVLGTLELGCSENLSKTLNVLWMTAAAVVLSLLPNYILGGFSNLTLKPMILSVLVCGAVLLLGYVCTRNARASVLLSFVLLFGLVVADYYVVKFRGDELTPADIFAIRTAVNVASQYEYSVDIGVIYFLCMAADFCFAGFCVPNFKVPLKKNQMLKLIASELVLLSVVILGIRAVEPVAGFMASGTGKYGVYVNFLSKLNEMKIESPEGYDLSVIRSLEEQYSRKTAAEETKKKPHIIMIMCEAFADLRKIGEFETDSEVMPFYDTLEENAIKGNALVTAYAGGTCNSEFEALTGFSMNHLPMDSFPYQQYITQNMWSMAHHLKKLGYVTMGTHPEKSTNWKRSTVYPYLGLDENRFIESYPQQNLIRGHVSDQEMYEQIIEWYEDAEKGSPLFYHGVTMQNHSPFDVKDFETAVHLSGDLEGCSSAEQYLSLVQKSDKALGEFIEYFKTAEEDVVIVFFGDHMPDLGEFYQKLNGGPLDTLEAKLNRQTVPFFVWANYDIEEEWVEYTSLNFLTNFIYKAAGIELPAYQRFLEDVRTHIPAMCALGYYSAEKGAFAAWDEITEEETELMKKYSYLQYNGMFDQENLSKLFFR